MRVVNAMGDGSAVDAARAFVEQATWGPHLCVLKTRVPGVTSYVILVAGASIQGICVVSEDAKKAHFSGRIPRGYERDAKQSALLEGGIVTRIGARSVVVERAGETYLVAIRGASLVIKKGEAPFDDELAARGEEESTRTGEALLARIVRGAVDLYRAVLTAALKKARARVSRRLAAVEKDLLAMSKADDMLLSAQWLLPEAHRAKRGQKEIVATDWSADPPREIRVALDPAKTPRDQVEAMFSRARRLKVGRAFAEPRRASTAKSDATLADIQARALAADSLDALEALAVEAKAAAPKDFTIAEQKAGERDPRDPRDHPDARGHRVYEGAGGAKILVGRGAKENDVLTFKVARPHDVWLHAKGQKGAHVVVPRDKKNQDIAPELLIDAAHLAAHFSDARGESIIDVEYTHRKFVKKPKGGAPGLVIVEREKVIAVRVEPVRLARLLGEGA